MIRKQAAADVIKVVEISQKQTIVFKVTSQKIAKCIFELIDVDLGKWRDKLDQLEECRQNFCELLEKLMGMSRTSLESYILKLEANLLDLVALVTNKSPNWSKQAKILVETLAQAIKYGEDKMANVNTKLLSSSKEMIIKCKQHFEGKNGSKEDFLEISVSLLNNFFSTAETLEDSHLNEIISKQRQEFVAKLKEKLDIEEEERFVPTSVRFFRMNY